MRSELGRLEESVARQALLAGVQDLGDLEVRQAVYPVVGVRHGVPRRLLRAGHRGAVRAVVRRAAVAQLAHAGEKIGQQRAQGDRARADDAHVHLDHAEIGDRGAVPRHVHGQGGVLDGENAGDGYYPRAAGPKELSKRCSHERPREGFILTRIQSRTTP